MLHKVIMSRTRLLIQYIYKLHPPKNSKSKIRTSFSACDSRAEKDVLIFDFKFLRGCNFQKVIQKNIFF
jgi:hypothetical protein